MPLFFLSQSFYRNSSCSSEKETALGHTVRISILRLSCFSLASCPSFISNSIVCFLTVCTVTCTSWDTLPKFESPCWNALPRFQFRVGNHSLPSSSSRHGPSPLHYNITYVRISSNLHIQTFTIGWCETVVPSPPFSRFNGRKRCYFPPMEARIAILRF